MKKHAEIIKNSKKEKKYSTNLHVLHVIDGYAYSTNGYCLRKTPTELGNGFYEIVSGRVLLLPNQDDYSPLDFNQVIPDTSSMEHFQCSGTSSNNLYAHLVCNVAEKSVYVDYKYLEMVCETGEGNTEVFYRDKTAPVVIKQGDTLAVVMPFKKI